MTTLHQTIAEKFLLKLAESDDVDAEKIEQLRKLFEDNKRVKAEDFVKIFTATPDEDVK